MKGLETEYGQMRPVICIAGPTASGKTDYAVRVAEAVGGEIINADAMQVYADISVLSARPTLEDQRDIPHHLFGYVSGKTLYSTGQWLRDAVPIILDILARDHTPILVGGTGLYFKALLEGLADIPAVPNTVQVDVEALPIDALRAEAQSVDPVATSRILGHDPQRLQRVVGVYRSTGRALSDWQSETHPIVPQRFTRRTVLMPEREHLYDRIDRRFDSMVAAGGLKEAQHVASRDYPERSPMVKAIGLSHLLSHLEGDCDLDTAIRLAKRDSRRLAKRQMTWFRNRCANWDHVKDDKDRETFLDSLT